MFFFFLNVEKKKWLSYCLFGLNDLFVSPWRNDCCGRLPCDMLAGFVKKNWSFLSDLIIEQKKKMEPSALVGCPRLSSNLPVFVSPLIWYFWPPFLLLIFLSTPHPLSFYRKKLRGCGSRRATNPLVPCHLFSMQLFWIASTKCPDLKRNKSIFDLPLFLVLIVEWGQLWWQK